MANTTTAVQNYPPGLYILVTASDGVFITTPSSFFRPTLPFPISETKEDCETLLNSWIASKKAVAFRWNSTSKTEWNLFNYSLNFTDSDGQHIFKSGVVNSFSESSKEISAERNKLLLELYGKEVLKTNAGKREHIYPTSKCPTPGTRKSPRKSVNIPTVQQSKEVSAVKQKTVPVKPKSTSLAIPKAAVPSAVPCLQKAIESLLTVPGKHGVKRKLQYPESSDEDEPDSEKDDDFLGSINSTSSELIKSSDVSPSNEYHKETEAHKDQDFVISEKENSHAQKQLHSGSDKVENLDCKDIIIEELRKENESLKENNRVLEEKVTDYYNTIASKEFENIELREKIEGLEKEDPIVLVREMKETLETMKSLVGNIISSPAVHMQQNGQPPGPGARSQYLSSPSSNSCHIGAKLVKLWGEVFISESVPKKVKTILKCNGQTEFSRNRAVTVILENLFAPEQLANMSLSGRKSPGIPDAIPKPKIPDKIQEAIHNFMQAAWDEAFSMKDEKGNVTTMAVLSTIQINKAIGARLLACHTHLKKKKNPPSQGDPSITEDIAFHQ